MQFKTGKGVGTVGESFGIFEEQSIEFIYGMKWLKNNDKMVKQNQKLIEQNPFLSYAIIIEWQGTQKLQSREKEIYTNFPILDYHSKKSGEGIGRYKRRFYKL